MSQNMQEKVKRIFEIYGLNDVDSIKAMEKIIRYVSLIGSNGEIEFVESRASSSFYQYSLEIVFPVGAVSLGITGENTGRRGEIIYHLFWTLFKMFKQNDFKVSYRYIPFP